MEAVAMAAVLGSCCSRPVCNNFQNNIDRISAVKKLASSALSKKKNETNYDESWNQINIDDVNKKILIKNEAKDLSLNDEDKFNNNSMIKTPLDNEFSQRLKSSFMFSTPFSPNNTLNDNNVKNNGFFFGLLNSNNYGRRRVSCSTNATNHTTESLLQRKQAYASNTIYVSIILKFYNWHGTKNLFILFFFELILIKYIL